MAGIRSAKRCSHFVRRCVVLNSSFSYRRRQIVHRIYIYTYIYIYIYGTTVRIIISRLGKTIFDKWKEVRITLSMFTCLIIRRRSLPFLNEINIRLISHWLAFSSKLFQTGSVDMVIECRKMFNFLPLKYQVDIRTASFRLRFISSENTICHLFISHAALAWNSIYNRYGGLVGSLQSLKDAIMSQFC